MYIFHKESVLNHYLKETRQNCKSIGFIPTMGALHEGHLSLIHHSQSSGDITVCSIFVNPTQFNNPEDLAKYPRTIEQDIALLEETGCKVLYLPTIKDIYPDGVQLKQPYDIGFLDTILEGKYRPGHFQGVSQVVDRFLQIVKPDNLYLGQKDYQQCMVLKRLIETKHAHINLHIFPTKREQDGLAMSSRNRRLTEPQRALAAIIYQCLVSIQSKKEEKNFPVVKKECGELLVRKGFKVDYIELADADTLELLDNYDTNKKMVALIAAFLGEIRLIDNIEL